MKFDVIVGNPPYQLNDGGGKGSSAIPIYQKFVEQAKKLNPNYLSMIIPSRWFTGGRGLDQFRDEMINDRQIRILHDFPDASECFPGVEIKGGVCYFLWDRNNEGGCEVNTHVNSEIISSRTRFLIEEENNVFIRNNEAIDILEKIKSHGELRFSTIVSANDPFGFDVREKGSYRRLKPQFETTPFRNSVEFYYHGWMKKGLGYISQALISRNVSWINKHKILIPKAWGVGDVSKDRLNPFLVGPDSCATETYLVVGPFEDEQTAQNAITYMNTKFFHFMVSLMKNTQNTMQKAYSYVPMQDFSQEWDDVSLYKKYQLTAEEIDWIEVQTSGNLDSHF